MKRWGKVIVLIILLILAMFIARNASKVDNSTITNTSKSAEKEYEQLEYSEDIEVVATLVDKIKSNSTWCGTFQLVWNDMQNEVVKQDIIFQKQLDVVENLNKQTFTEEDVSDEYYYKKFGLLTLNLKDEIEKGIEDKFNEKSDILDNIDWSNVPQDETYYNGDSNTYLFYAMLFREFTFKREFSKLDNDKFEGSQETYEDIEYFGIDRDSSEKLYSQVDVLYYNSNDNYAVILNTKEGDEIILVKGNNGNTFLDIYNNVMNENYDGDTSFTENDTLKVPKLNFKLLNEYEELEFDGTTDKIFYNSIGNTCRIDKAIQSIEMSLDETGGKVKSEAAIIMTETAMIVEDEPKVEYRDFKFDSEFTIFIRDGEKDLPYFAANIDDITLFQ